MENSALKREKQGQHLTIVKKDHPQQTPNQLQTTTPKRPELDSTSHP